MLSFISAALLALLLSTGVTKEDVRRLLNAGVSERTIVEFIHRNAPAESLSVEEVMELKAAGATDAILTAMLEASRTTEAVTPSPSYSYGGSSDSYSYPSTTYSYSYPQYYSYPYANYYYPYSYPYSYPYYSYYRPYYYPYRYYPYYNHYYNHYNYGRTYPNGVSPYRNHNNLQQPVRPQQQMQPQHSQPQQHSQPRPQPTQPRGTGTYRR